MKQAIDTKTIDMYDPDVRDSLTTQDTPMTPASTASTSPPERVQRPSGLA